MTDWINQATDIVSGSPWTYAWLFVVSALDAILPFVPSETSVITAGVLAADGDLILWLVILTAALGAILGDNVSYWIGRTAGHRVVLRLLGEKRHAKFMEMEHSLAERGGYLIIVGRFIPGGRIAVTFGAGTLEFPGGASSPSTWWPGSCGRATRRCSATSAARRSRTTR